MNIMASRAGWLYRGTPAEQSLEDAIGALGVPYRFQFPGYLYGVRYFPDFYLPTLRLVVEVDDNSHKDPEKIAADEARTRDLHRAWGVRVVRCTNREALDDPHGTVKRMLSSVGLWPIPSHLPPIAAALPSLKKCPRKDRKGKNELSTDSGRRRGVSRGNRRRTKGDRSTDQNDEGR